MGKLLKSVLDAVLPPRCLLCGKVLSGENGLCGDCFAKINFISAPVCKRCGQPLPPDSHAAYCANCVGDNLLPFGMIRSRIKYDEFSKPLITRIITIIIIFSTTMYFGIFGRSDI